MGLSHYRKGPNKVLIWGISQPIADALKLLTKETPKIPFLKVPMFLRGPFLGLLLILMGWVFYDFTCQSLCSSIKILIIFSIMRLIAYPFLLIRWGSSSKYAILGGYRAVAQIISYEVCLILYALLPLYVFNSFRFENTHLFQQGWWFILFCVPVFLNWVVLCMAESNRTPFDLAEGESEIVSGFNIEYGGGLFAFIFIAEYGIIILLRFLTTVLFLGGNFILFKTFLFCFLYVWIRCSFPRVRYDFLIIFSWKMALPYSLALLVLMLLLRV